MGAFLLSLICMIDDGEEWVQKNDEWFPKVLLLVFGLGHAVYSLWHKMDTVVQATSFVGAFLFFCGIDYCLGNGQLVMLAERYLISFKSFTEPSENTRSICKCTSYMFI